MIFVFDKVFMFKGYFKTLGDARKKYRGAIFSEMSLELKPMNSILFLKTLRYIKTDKLSYYKTLLAIKRHQLLYKKAIESRNTSTFYKETKKLKKFIQRGKFINPEVFLVL